MDHVGEECADVAFAFDSIVDREAVRALYFHVAFPEQFAVRLVALVDFVEHDLVVDVADVGDSRRQCGVLVGEVQVQLGEFAEPSLGSSPSFLALSAASTASWVSLRVLRTPSISLVANNSSLMECRM